MTRLLHRPRDLAAPRDVVVPNRRAPRWRTGVVGGVAARAGHGAGVEPGVPWPGIRAGGNADPVGHSDRGQLAHVRLAVRWAERGGELSPGQCAPGWAPGELSR